MNLLNKLTIKNLKLNQKRTIVTIIGIILSVSLITAVASMFSSGLDSLINYETAQKGNFHVAYLDVPKEDLNIFTQNREIESINLTQNIGYAYINSLNTYKPYAMLKAFTQSSLDNLAIRLVKGRLPRNNQEILIPTHLKTNGRVNLKVGETITLDVGRRVSKANNQPLEQNDPLLVDDDNKSIEDIINPTAMTYKIVGVIERPSLSIENFSSPGYTFITYASESELSGNVDVYALFTHEGVKNVYQITANILGVNEDLFVKANNKDMLVDQEQYEKEMAKAKYEFATNQRLINLEINPIASSDIAGLGVVLCIVIIIILVTSIFCIKNSFDISITEKIKQYGMLRSLGATQKQIKKNVFYEATILGVIGIPLGVLCGFIASFILVLVCNYYFNSITEGMLTLKFHFSLFAIIIALVLGIITIYFSAFRSAKKASKTSPIDLIRNSASIKIKNKKLRTPKFIKKLMGIGGEISYKNMLRNKKKYRTTVISITTSVATFIGLFAFMDMAYQEVKEEINFADYNLSLSTNSVNKDNYSKFVDTTTLDNIEDFTILRYASFTVTDPKYSPEYLKKRGKVVDKEDNQEYVTIYALGKEQYQKFTKSLGLKEEEIKSQAIFLEYLVDNEPVSMLNYEVNDTLTGLLGDNKYTFTIGAVTKNRPFGLKDYNVYTLIVSDELFDQISNSSYMQILYKSSNATKLQDDIDNYLADETYSLNNQEENVKMMKNLLTLVSIFLYGFIIVVSLIGITNIFNTITTNMELRRQEFAMLKSIGMTKKEFNRMIRLESMFIGFKALFIGIPIGIGISYLIYKGFNETSYHLPVVGILISVFTVLVLITLIMKYSLKKINKQNIIETIRNDNI